MSSLPNVNTTLGPLFLGNIVAGILYGVTTFQTFLYFKGKPRDRPAFRLLIGVLWFVISMPVLLIYPIFSENDVDMNFQDTRYYPDGIHDPWGLLLFNSRSLDGSILSQVIAACIGDLIVRCIFARRIWFLSDHNKPLVLGILVMAALVFASGMAFVARGFLDGTYAKLDHQSWSLYTALGSSVLADIVVAVALCVLLDHRRSGFKSTDSLLNTIMLYTINTGVLTTICAMACFVTYTIWKHTFIYIGIYFVLTKLYIATILVVLNTRKSLQSKNPGIRTIPNSPSAIESPLGFMPSLSNGQSASSIEPPQPPKLAFKYESSPA